MQQQSEEFTFNRVGTTGCDIRDPDGLVVAWTVDEVWAAAIVKLLNNDPCVAVDAGEMPEAACCCGGVKTATNKKSKGELHAI